MFYSLVSLILVLLVMNPEMIKAGGIVLLSLVVRDLKALFGEV